MMGWGKITELTVSPPCGSLRIGDCGSYGVNGWCGWDNVGNPRGNGPKIPAWLWGSIAMKGADRVPMFLDLRWYTTWMVNRDSGLTSSIMNDGSKTRVGLRHGSKSKGGVCMVFADSSARKVETGKMRNQAGELRRPCELYELKWHREFHNGDACSN